MSILPRDEVALAAALATGDPVAALGALRTLLAGQLLAADTATAAALSREMRAVLEAHGKAGAGLEGSVSDDVARKRAERLARQRADGQPDADDAAPAARRRQRRA